MTFFCQFKDALGKPGQGFHAPRLLGLARNDLIGTVVLAWLIARFTRWSWLKAFFVMFAIGTALHLLFCVDTAFLKAFF